MTIASKAGTISLMIALLFASGASTAEAATDQTRAAALSPTEQVRAAGSFTASVDFASLVPTPIGKRRCQFQVEGTLTFVGTLTGAANGVTTALIQAPCEDALSNPPGTFADVFRFEGSFTGTAAGVSVTDAELRYAGVTRPGGLIDATIKLGTMKAKATLRTAGARLGLGGNYHGVVITHR